MALKNMEDFVVTFEEVKVNDKVRETYRGKKERLQTLSPQKLAGTLSPLVQRIVIYFLIPTGIITPI